MVSLPRPSLHPPITTNSAHVAFITQALADAAASRTQALPPIPATGVAPPSAAKVSISMLTASAASGFDSYLFVRFRGGQLVQVLADSGNNCLVMPSLDGLQALPNFNADYTVLADNIQEPFGRDAALVRGPIEIPAVDGTTVTLPACTFFACTGSGGTANFGLGVVTTWSMVNNITVQAPLTYNADYRYAEVDLVDVPRGLDDAGNPSVSDKSLLTLYKAQPLGYAMLAIKPNVDWMALIPQKLSINGTLTNWPGNLDDPIAMIDTGGEQIYLSDPNGAVYEAQWPNPGDVPGWASTSDTCVATKSTIAITLGDANSAYSYTVDASALPATDQDTTLVMCKNCQYMQGANGMNIGGLSMLFNSLLIDYRAKQVGFQKKRPADV